MKRIKFLSFCCIAVFLLMACGNKITVKGENGTEYDSYQECCAAQDFQAAHQYLAKLKNSNSEELQMQWYDAKEYVFKQEALYLMSIGDEAAKKRIIYLLKEEGGDDYYDKRINGHVAMLIDLAIDNDDEAFVKTLANQYNSDAEKDDLKKVVDYLYSKDMTRNCEYLTSLLNNLKATKILLDYAINSGNLELVKKVASQGLEIQDSELISQLASLKNKEISDDIINLISKIKIEGVRVPSSIYDDDVFDYKSYLKDRYNKNYVEYIRSINEYNKACDQILEISINKGNDYLAKNVILKYKEDVIKLQGGDDVKAPNGNKISDYCYYVYYTNDSKNNAQKRYREAKNNGAFKK